MDDGSLLANSTSSPGNQAAKDDVVDTGLPLALLGLVLPHGVCALFILGRLYARVVLLRKWFLDDTLIVLSFLFSTAVCVIYSVASKRPDILHADEEALQSSLGPGNQWAVHPYILRTYLGLIFYQVCLCLNKLSILSFYLRMFNSRPKERILVLCTIAFVIAFGLPMLFMSIFQCHPTAGRFFGRPMYCFKFADLLISSATFHALTDTWLLLIIVPVISGLDIPAKQKIVLSVVLNLGIFVITAGVVRLMLSLRENFRPDLVGVTTTLGFFIMTILECDLAIICASAPTLRPLFARVFPWIMRDPRRRSMRPGFVPGVALTSPARRLTTRRSPNSNKNKDDSGKSNGRDWTEPVRMTTTTTMNTSSPLVHSRNASNGSRFSKLTRKGGGGGGGEAGGLATPAPVLGSSSTRTKTSSHKRTATTAPLSLRSMASVIGVGGSGSRSREHTRTGDGRPILDNSQTNSVTSDMQFEAGRYDERPPQQYNQRIPMVRWRQSRESLVVGENDPMGRVSPPQYGYEVHAWSPRSGGREGGEIWDGSTTWDGRDRWEGRDVWDDPRLERGGHG
ncbi:hypothetical protein ACRALDRAFT_1073928 [Sodiomyces alcalophilus JCM 7366]|uniref:uncharacterized protein n=1 Tax=Sodiomyces alcalophilus JCM 7366 TaxID=591952 RepID=UPI0039B53803